MRDPLFLFRQRPQLHKLDCGYRLGDGGILSGILSSQLLHEHVVGSPSRPRLKQAVRTLEGDRLGLGDAEEDEDKGHGHERGKEEEDGVAPGEEHLLGEAGDDEVPEPVVGGGVCLAERARVLVEHLGADDPRRAVPGGRVDGGPQVEEDDGGHGRGRERGVGRVGGFDEGADAPHAEGAADGADQEEPASADVVDDDEPDNGQAGLDEAEDARRQEARRRAPNAHVAEDGGTVVVDGVDSGA